MRVYVPTTLPGLATARDVGELGPVPLTAYAVTPALREWYVSEDVEELEYAALTRAAQAGLRLLETDPEAPRRRVVVAADVPDGSALLAAEEDRAAVRLDRGVPLAKVAAVHVDEADAEDDVAAAARSCAAARRGDEDARFVVDGAEGHELLWYATQEIDDLLA